MNASGATATPAAARTTPAVRWFGRLQLLRLLGKSDRTMAWRAADPRTGQELMLVLPRVQPADPAALERWEQGVRRAARLAHPQLAAVVEVGVQDGWPFVAYDPRDDATLAERLPADGQAGLEAAACAAQLLQGLAFAHEAGIAHLDLQPYLVLVGDGGAVRVAGLAAAGEPALQADELQQSAVEPGALRRHRAAAERDVLAAGLMLHGQITGQPALGEADIGRAIVRLAPLGREVARLPWDLERLVAEPLRAIANRATDRQERQRYRNARTLLRALEGWMATESGAGGGALVLLSERLRTAGVLPSLPGAAARAARLALMERERTNELAEVVLEDLALSFELLRLVNTAQVRGVQVAGGGPVLTVRRAIAMVGLDGVRRAALGLRDWPGPLGAGAAGQLEQLLQRCKRAGRVAQALRPAGYDGEVVYLVTLLQNLGRLLLHYHFPDEAAQIQRLMQPAPAARAGDPEEPGLPEQAACYAVLGVDVEALGAAVARHWGLDDSVLTMIRREPLTTPVRSADSDDDMLRCVASCANEAVDTLALPAPRAAAALQRVAQRYARVLGLGPRDLQQALLGLPLGGRPDGAAPASTRPTPLREAAR